MFHQDYVYQPIRSETGIRVLLLEPARDYNAQLFVSLQHVQISPYRQDGSRANQDIPSARSSTVSLLATAPVQYEAMSYAWGDQQPTERLTIKGSTPHQNIMIRPNVDTMLRHLRSSTQQRRLWIDALCINQNDLEEKGSQVRFMEEVYRQAKAIVIWLGTPEDEAGTKNTTMRFFQQLVKYGPADGRHEEEQAATWAKLEAFLSRSWFTRRWTIQEALLAKQATILCGSYIINFMVFAKNAFLTAQRQAHLTPSISGALRKLWIMYRLRSAPIPEVRSDPLRLLVDFSTADCMDARDRIYALNAVSNVKVPVSYTETVENVYVSYAEMHISLGSFAVMNCAGATHLSASTVPSWVPDWRCPLVFTPLTTRPVDSAQNDSETKALATPSIDTADGYAILGISGVKVGIVSHIGTKAPYPVWGREILSILLNWYNVFEAGKINLVKHPGNKDDSSSQFVSAITLGCVVQRTTALSPDHPWLRDKHPDFETEVSWLLAHLIAEAREETLNATLQRGDAEVRAQELANIEAAASQVSEGLKSILKSLMLDTADRNAELDIQHDITLIWSFKDPLMKEGWYDRNLEPDEVVEILRRTIAGRTCFWSGDGSFGLGPASMELGDVVVAIPSCPTPYVLRPKLAETAKPEQKSNKWSRTFGRATDDDNEDEYTLVGDCYIHDYAPEDLFQRPKQISRFHIV
ncbi:hypothetical protein HBI25_123300 [Parastagonospora nodorum]|nr:hypothetical protein HBI10_113900 [Parastagonospora nodorum]KAH4014749.1 hypothetical protein HBI13_170220 [Parastagonospora nodorum]KAH4035176.1 hypothetical protein HBI09_096350 [Parastagonospora nodorum]KAH4222302.1 hypothetical protein HBI06_146070 [Parastagonospora nodorum]KAH4232291.1 hypothetical protein HBI05_176640 [Parastagonospora nodorum]